ncbi:crotonase/enoyl-CoA hydratase family protein [Paracraurococcus ruber]|uniref:crotonase/enoyl-CoA hydratase family protein n=1 Tax=Paracraurococcus ruber TaxID=77675 RepID=UPI001EFF8E06|nr:crotonase/enoyl-CoA hydratase family protein [Paracraurococcus ruber]
MTYIRSPLATGLAPSATQVSLGSRPAATHETLDTAYDAERGIYWCRLRPTERPCFSPELLRDIASMHAAIPDLFAAGSPLPAPRWFVCGSAIPGIYNLGGDLGLFRRLIAAGDRDGLLRYGHAAVEAIHRNHTALDLPMITVALVQGDALGGGFECALAHDLIVAERSAKFGLPEVLFNLFPGMGAASFLSRRIGRAAAEALILSGEIHTAEAMHAMGLVDILAEDGEGETALQAFIAKQDRFHNARQAMARARRRVDPVTIEELRDIVEIWADAAMRLSEQDLRRMARLCGAQDRRMAVAA